MAKINERICNSNTIAIQSMFKMWDMRYHDDNFLTTTNYFAHIYHFEKRKFCFHDALYSILQYQIVKNLHTNILNNKLELTYLKNSYMIVSMYSFGNEIKNNSDLKFGNISMLEIARPWQ